LKPWLDDFVYEKGKGQVIVVSRHPMDVARMSDFSATRSCHKETGSHFECAMAEMKGHGLVAYLVDPEDFEKIDLEDDEIFGDLDVGLAGPRPKARTRLRKLYNPDTEEEFAVVEDNVYGQDQPDFVPSLRKWAREEQRDVWGGEDGRLDTDKFSDSDWVLAGGEYVDTDIRELLMAMFEGTEDEEAANEYSREDYQHEDLFSEGGEALAEQAEERLNVIDREANDRADHGGFYMSIEEGWDGVPFYFNASYSVDFSFEFDDEWDDHPDRFIVPTGGGGETNWAAHRAFTEDLDKALTSVDHLYMGYNAEWEIRDTDEDNEIVIQYREDAEITQGGMDGLDEIEEWANTVVDDFESRYGKVKFAIKRMLIEEDYLPPGPYEKATSEVPKMEFKNLHVSYDEEDPDEGISITFKEDIVPIGLYKKINPNGEDIGTDFLHKLSTDAAKGEMNINVLLAFNQLSRAAEREAAKQMTMQFPRKQGDLFDKFAMDPRYQRADPKMPKFPVGAFQVYYRLMADPENQDYIKIGLFMETDIGIGVREETYAAIKTFVQYVDNNISMLEQAAVKIADEAYQEVGGRGDAEISA
jgi:hypothetical protein